MTDDLEDLARRQARAQNGLDPSHARPQPWFVGSGRRLMWLIVTLVAVLVALRGVTTWWLAQDAWAWWTHRPPARVAPPPITRAEPAPAALPLPPGAIAPTGNAAEWISADDYPIESIRREEQGKSLVRWVVDPDGRVRRCGTVSSSGFPRLDAAACAAIIRNARYAPARDASGRAIATTAQRRVVWLLPRQRSEGWRDRLHTGGRSCSPALCPGA